MFTRLDTLSYMFFKSNRDFVQSASLFFPQVFIILDWTDKTIPASNKTCEYKLDFVQLKRIRPDPLGPTGPTFWSPGNPPLPFRNPPYPTGTFITLRELPLPFRNPPLPCRNHYYPAGIPLTLPEHSPPLLPCRNPCYPSGTPLTLQDPPLTLQDPQLTLQDPPLRPLRHPPFSSSAGISLL